MKCLASAARNLRTPDKQDFLNQPNKEPYREKSGSESHSHQQAIQTAVMAPSFEQLDPETEYDDDEEIDFSGRLAAVVHRNACLT